MISEKLRSQNVGGPVIKVLNKRRHRKQPSGGGDTYSLITVSKSSVEFMPKKVKPKEAETKKQGNMNNLINTVK